MELVEFIFKNGWTFVGTCVLVYIIGQSIASIIAAFRG